MHETLDETNKHKNNNEMNESNTILDLTLTMISMSTSYVDHKKLSLKITINLSIPSSIAMKLFQELET